MSFKKIVKRALMTFLGLIAAYVLAALVLEHIYIGEKQKEAAGSFIAYVSSSDIHTEFVFPIKNALFNWSDFIPKESVTSKISDPKYIAIGWGSRDFYFHMRTWDEINVPVILGAVFLPGESTLHVEYLADLDKAVSYYPLSLTKEQYPELVSYVKGFFILDQLNRAQKISEFSYYETDKFFRSKEKYHMFNTCNMWTQKGLAKINWRRPLWAPTKYGIERALR